MVREQELKLERKRRPDSPSVFDIQQCPRSSEPYRTRRGLELKKGLSPNLIYAKKCAFAKLEPKGLRSAEKSIERH